MGCLPLHIASFLFFFLFFYIGLQVIALTEELLATARQNEISAQDMRASATDPLGSSQTKGLGNKKMV